MKNVEERNKLIFSKWKNWVKEKEDDASFNEIWLPLSVPLPHSRMHAGASIRALVTVIERNGIFDNQFKTLQQTADLLGYKTRERIRQLENKGIRIITSRIASKFEEWYVNALYPLPDFWNCIYRRK